MTTSLILSLIWLVAANISGMIPFKDNHWKAAYLLIALGIPVLIGVYLQNGWLTALIVLIAAASILRWPVIYLIRWLKDLAK